MVYMIYILIVYFSCIEYVKWFCRYYYVKYGLLVKFLNILLNEGWK